MDREQAPGPVPRDPFLWQLPPSQWDTQPFELNDGVALDPFHPAPTPAAASPRQPTRDPMYRAPPPGSFDFDFNFNDPPAQSARAEETARYADRPLPPVPARPASPDGWSVREPQGFKKSGASVNGIAPVYKESVGERSFLEWYPIGNGTLLYHNKLGEMESIQALNIELIRERSPILAMAFEDSRSGPQLFLETLTSATALPFLRFLYSGSYALGGPDGDFYEDVPTSVLLHCQLYRLGDIYDLEGLKTQAYVNVFRQCEFGCSSPDKPINLCAAIRYFYQHLAKHERLINTMIDYCVSCFLRHRLGEDAEFRQMAYELRPFHQALCMNSRERGFENEAAAAIIQLPFKPYVPETYASREDASAQRFDDVVFHFHSHDDLDGAPKKRKRPEIFDKRPASMVKKLERFEKPTAFPSAPASSSSILPLRPRVNFLETTMNVPSDLKPVFLADRVSVRQTSDSAAPSSVPEPREASPQQDGAQPSELSSETSVPAKSDTGSDSEFEMVSSPAKVEEFSDCESDDSAMVEITREEARAERSPRSQQSTLAESAAVKTQPGEGDWDADSDWELM